MLFENEIKEFIENFNKEKFDEELNKCLKSIFRIDVKFSFELNVSQRITDSCIDVYDENRYRVTSLDINHTSMVIYGEQVKENSEINSYLTHKILNNELRKKLKETN